jgi:hypothetical protein
MKSTHTPASASRLLLAALAATAMLVAFQPKAEAKISTGGAAILGGVAGLAVGAAIADSQRNKKIYYQGYNPPYPPGGYGPYFNQAFSPTAGVVCYPAQRLCYNNAGSISGKWTRNVYGY